MMYKMNGMSLIITKTGRGAEQMVDITRVTEDTEPTVTYTFAHITVVSPTMDHASCHQAMLPVSVRVSVCLCALFGCIIQQTRHQ